MKTVAVIDVGSNTIKNLVAEKNAETNIAPVFERTEEVRLSKNLSDSGELDPSAIDAVCEAVSRLIADTTPFAPEKIACVATSAVREAPNRNLFLAKIQKTCGIAAQVFSGEQEARFVARGVATEPALKNVDSFNLADLGGGSLECVRIESRIPACAKSFPLGAVRLTRKFVSSPDEPVPENLWDNALSLANSFLKGFPFANSMLVGTGGAFNAARAIFSPQKNLSTAGELTFEQIESLYRILAPLTWAERCKKFPALSPARADIMPAALAVIAATMKAAKTPALLHTLRNLRYGVADALLNGETIR